MIIKPAIDLISPAWASSGRHIARLSFKWWHNTTVCHKVFCSWHCGSSFLEFGRWQKQISHNMWLRSASEFNTWAWSSFLVRAYNRAVNRHGGEMLRCYSHGGDIFSIVSGLLRVQQSPMMHWCLSLDKAVSFRKLNFIRELSSWFQAFVDDNI